MSPEEAAHALKARRADLRRRLDCRRDITAIPAFTRDELVDEAIGLVVMSSKAIRDEQHLEGAFWSSIGYLLMEYRSGRREINVGSRRRVEFEAVAETLPDDGQEPFDFVSARERMAAAADFMAQLDPFEQRVVAVMSAHGLGVKRAARALGEPIKTVLAASRSAEEKLERVATIAAAGRLCDYREAALREHARGTAHVAQATAARAHLAACASCRSSYATLLRESRTPEFRRAASAAFLPAPLLTVEVHGRWIERLTSLLSTGRAPSGTGTAERAAGVLGGGGLVKAAAVTSAIVVAGASVGARVVHSLDAPVHHHATPDRSSTRPVTATAPHAVASAPPTWAPTVSAAHARATAPVTHHATPPPSHDLGYLALGGSGSEGESAPRATAASVPPGSSPVEPRQSPPPTPSGGGSSLNYLGR